MSKVAFCFPGQGSQRVGMAQDFDAAFAESAAVFDQASAATGIDLRSLCFEGPIEELSKTELTQPALVTASVAALRAIESRYGTAPDVVVGHSVGEYAALVAAGGIDVAGVSVLVRERGLATAESKAGGGMAAVLRLSDEQVEELCAARDDVWPANYNCPGQVVISGTDAGIAAIAAQVEELRGKFIRLQVSGPFHSPLMGDAADRLSTAVAAATFTELRTGFMSTVSNQLETADHVPALLIDQLTAPVRFTQAVQALIADGVDTFVEVGPGGVLAGLVKRISKTVTAVTIGNSDDLDSAEAILG
jgi:[acyl-carrier-protein] S-malonyltransferase